MTYDFNITAKGLDGKDEKDTLATIIASYLGSETDVAALKFFGWYNDLRNGKTLELDEVDKKLFSDYIENNKRMMVFVKGQALNVLK